MELRNVIRELRLLANPDKVKFKQEKFGIRSTNSLGIYQSDLQLFDSGIYEARILCSKIYKPESLTERQMDKWVVTFENWEICDSFCMGLFSKSRFALTKAIAWSGHESEFVKRAGFVIIASYGFANKSADNDTFIDFLNIIETEVEDNRIYVRKAVNWALRNIGKRNIDLHAAAVKSAKKILKNPSKSAQWIAKDALKELMSPAIKMLDYPRGIYRRKE